MHLGCWMAPPRGITMKDWASTALFPNLSAWLESENSQHPLACLIIQTIILTPPSKLAACHICSDRRGWKLAEGIPSHGAPGLSITFQLANELLHRCSSWSEWLQSQPEELRWDGEELSQQEWSTSSHKAMKLAEYNIITIMQLIKHWATKRPIMIHLLRPN